MNKKHVQTLSHRRRTTRNELPFIETRFGWVLIGPVKRNEGFHIGNNTGNKDVSSSTTHISLTFEVFIILMI